MVDAVVLSRCLHVHGMSRRMALPLSEACRKPRTSVIPAGSRANGWLRDWLPEHTDPAWVYGYDALSAPLDGDEEGAGIWALHR